MGNSSGKESRPSSALGHTRADGMRHGNAANPTSPPPQQATHDRHAIQIYSSRGGRSSRQDLQFGAGGRDDRDQPPPPPVEQRRETKAEREARRLERERAIRAKDRERSMREEGVDGGYLVTLGTYTGTEDFSKPIVRQLMIERRLAPFWKGLNDFKEDWVEHQLVAAAQGKEIPPADQIPPEESPVREERSSRPAHLNIDSLTVPIAGRSQSAASDRSGTHSPTLPAFSLPTTSPLGQSPSSSTPFFRGRAKTLASLTSTSRNSSQTEMVPQEINLPHDPQVNGMRTEAFLYKDASECPICFLYYPPYLNKTRCCDQPICSECFVQIKRPDPHPPEHHDPNNPEAPPPPQTEECMLVSEPAACPFCVQPEFGVTYEAPPFRRGLVYAHQSHTHPLANAASAMSSSTSLSSQGPGSPGSNSASRRRTTSLSATASQVITTDKVRPDWAKKLADARAHALRRAAAATALHNAAYVLGNAGSSDGRSIAFGRRRRTMFTESPNSSGRGTPRHGEVSSLSSVGALIAASERQAGIGRAEDGSTDLYPGRHSSRRTRVEDLEELMMMEAIRLSLAAEEERKRKEDKESAKEAKKEEKRKAKEAKKAEKAARKGLLYQAANDSDPGTSSAVFGKGKAVDRSGAGFNPLNEPTSTVNAGSSSKEDSQRHLEESRAQIQSQIDVQIPQSPAFSPIAESSQRPAQDKSTRSSSVSSFAESVNDSLKNVTSGAGTSFEPSPSTSGVNIEDSGPESSSTSLPPESPAAGGTGTEPMVNFSSLAAMIDSEDKVDQQETSSHIESAGESKITTIPETEPLKIGENSPTNLTQSHEEVGESSSSAVAPQVIVTPTADDESSNEAPSSEFGMDSSVATLKASTTMSDSVSPVNKDVNPSVDSSVTTLQASTTMPDKVALENEIVPEPRVEPVLDSGEKDYGTKKYENISLLEGEEDRQEREITH